MAAGDVLGVPACRATSDLIRSELMAFESMHILVRPVCGLVVDGRTVGSVGSAQRSKLRGEACSSTVKRYHRYLCSAETELSARRRGRGVTGALGTR